MIETILLKSDVNGIEDVIKNVDTFLYDRIIVPRIYYYTITERLLNPYLPLIENVYERTNEKDKNSGFRIYRFKCERIIKL